MLKRICRWLAVLAGVAIGCCTLAGCGSRNEVIPPKHDSILRVSIEWRRLDGICARAVVPSSIANSDVTHVGARIEYPDNNAVFMQSTERRIAQSVGLITMKVPPTRRANLYVVAVRDSGSIYGGTALYMGVVRNIEIAEETVLDIKMDDIQWTPATWRVSEEDEEIWNGDRVYEATADLDRLENPLIYVWNPFQAGENPEWDQLLVAVQGSSISKRENADGWHEFQINAKNHARRVDHFEEYSFAPYVRGASFNLPSGHYFIPPVDNGYQVHWQTP